MKANYNINIYAPISFNRYLQFSRKPLMSKKNLIDIGLLLIYHVRHYQELILVRYLRGHDMFYTVLDNIRKIKNNL